MFFKENFQLIPLRNCQPIKLQKKIKIEYVSREFPESSGHSLSLSEILIFPLKYQLGLKKSYIEKSYLNSEIICAGHDGSSIELDAAHSGRVACQHVQTHASLDVPHSEGLVARARDEAEKND